MPITPYLEGKAVDPEVRRVIGVAFELALAALRLSDRSDPVVAIVARKIIALAESGENNAECLCEQALMSLGAHERYPARKGGPRVPTPLRLIEDRRYHEGKRP